MEAVINICPDPKLLANSANPTVIGISHGNPPESGHVSESPRHYTIENIRARAETVTPLLSEILNYWPKEHWPTSE